MSAEDALTRVGISLKLCDIEQCYEVLRIPLPRRMKVAVWLLRQFEAKEFDFDVIQDEERLQDMYDEMEKEELIRVAGESGRMAVKLMNAKDKKHKEKLAKAAALPTKPAEPVVVPPMARTGNDSRSRLATTPKRKTLSRSPKKKAQLEKAEEEKAPVPISVAGGKTFVEQKMFERSYLGDVCKRGIKDVISNMTLVHREVEFYNKS